MKKKNKLILRSLDDYLMPEKFNPFENSIS
jgi:hypothetical protein